MMQYSEYGNWIVYFKTREYFWRKPYSWAVITSCSLKFDLLCSSTSNLTVNALPSNVREGDVVWVTDETGKHLYDGVITQIEGNELTCDDAYSLINQPVFIPKKYRWGCSTSVLMYNFFNHLEDQAKSSPYPDEKMLKMLRQIDITTTSNLNYFLWEFAVDGDETVYWRDLIFDVNSKGNFVMLEYSFKGDADNPDIFLTTSGYNDDGKKIDTTQPWCQTDVVVEKAQYNKLMLFNSEGKLRSTTYLTPNGIVTNPDSLSRESTINTKVICSDETGFTAIDLAKKELGENLENYKIECTFPHDQDYIVFDNYNVGDIVQVFAKGKVYTAVYSGFGIEYSSDTKARTDTMIFGKVRNRASQKWFQV